MKTALKLSTLLLITLFCYKATAQTISIKGGLNLSEMKIYDNDLDLDETNEVFSMKPGFHAGLSLDIPFSDVLSIETGLLLSSKGFKYEEEYEISGFGMVKPIPIQVKSEAKISLYYLDIPVTLKATHQFSDKLSVFGVVGPYVGFGLSGQSKEKSEISGEKETSEESIRWGTDEEEDLLKRVDTGITFGAGVEINAIMIGVSYDFGLANISSYQEDGTTIENRVLKFSVGYRLGN